MTSKEFAYWLQGFFELTDAKAITEHQVSLIKKHLNLVFYHEIDPSYTNDKNKQQEMNAIHSGIFKPNGGISPSENDTLLRC